MSNDPFKRISSDKTVIFIICLFGLMSQFATDSFTPSLPHIAEYFHAAAKDIKLTVGVYFFGMTCSMLGFGYLSDKYGRKPALLAGYLIFCVASILCMIAESETQLLFFRFLQGIGMGSSFVFFRAIMKDVFSDSQSLAKASLVITSIVSLTPPLAPITGGIIQETIGWRGNFTLHSIMAIIITVLIIKYLHLKAIPKRNYNVLDSYKRILTHKVFVLNAICSGLALSLVFVFATLSPFFFQIKLGFSAVEYSFISAGVIIPSAIFLILFKNIISRLDMNKVILYCGSFSTLSGLLLAFSYFIFGLDAKVIVILCALAFCGNVFQYTATYVCAYRDIHTEIGASAIFGFIQIAVTTISSSLVSSITLHNQLVFGLLMAIPPFLIVILKIIDIKKAL
ncbi:multidrug effflux MFS transporter [Francisella tularensis]|uniref:Major facilitator superfamily (MSF) transport protein n=3 Tax=Francisella tularensis TaxID=263 RepID=A0AAI8BHF7_FRATH|nr:MFS transporter [Francisella tularensis]AFX71298.1 major facilitator transporter [Francisella tularensis subsp. holarctica F92]EBA53121.1 major facilitator superfamily (MSF) transport protein [Francisella tularensis subsp. holarctica 257]ABI83403.1 MFS family major facilitator transporter [Francisella tularensis subsp. holarctica OSU18]ABU62258.1 major facilitator superfamily (MFS) transport protein [Francisella tularensis subsp. holarctica FTNF002-00]AFT93287.1 drug:H+ antiporter-1 (DHA1) 